jgi:alpha(1,3/1,4) fucosyltransferase
MIYSVLRGDGLRQNIIFNNNALENRDNCFLPYVLLKNKLMESGIQIDTQDFSQQNSIAFEIHQDYQECSVSEVNYLMMFETDLIKKIHADVDALKKYRKIFTWNDSLIDDNKFIKINFPNPIKLNEIDGFEHRDRFCCLIAGNKSLLTVDDRDLYVERNKVIRWFEKNKRDEFDLYGFGWDIPMVNPGFFSRINRNLLRLINKFHKLNAYPSYRGGVKNKSDVLTNVKFCICYENVADYKGYITEKIFDCFFSGCVPVYWGASNVDQYIPNNCFIDRRMFKNNDELYAHLKLIDECEYRKYQSNIREFLAGEDSYQFGAEYFAETVAKVIESDLKAYGLL